MPLVGPNGGDFPRDTAQRPTEELIAEDILRDIPGVYPHDPTAPAIAAIILSHSHLDHYGLAHHAHPAIPVYGSAGTIAILEVGRVFFPEASLPVDLRVLPTGEPVRFGGSLYGHPRRPRGPDSRALLVEADAQRLLYTGDLRAHGRTGFRFEKMLADKRLHVLSRARAASPRQRTTAARCQALVVWKTDPFSQYCHEPSSLG